MIWCLLPRPTGSTDGEIAFRSIQSPQPLAGAVPDALFPPSICVCVGGGCCSFFSLGNKPAKGSEPSRFVFACEGTGES